jgi:DNA-binding NarL/FixJ family response regulator
VSIVLNRSARDFADDDVAALDFVRGPLAALFRQVVEIHRLRVALRARASVAPPASALACMLTPREREVLDWVAAGKTDAEIASLTGAAVRTVQKHLQNVYVKLGVENRTAAAMRAVTDGRRPH